MSRQSELFDMFDAATDQGYPVLTSLSVSIKLGISEQVARTEIRRLQNAGWVEAYRGYGFNGRKLWTRSEKVGTP